MDVRAHARERASVHAHACVGLANVNRLAGWASRLLCNVCCCVATVS